MSSQLHYRFKAGSSAWSRLVFDGHALTLADVKREITIAKKLTPLADQHAAAGGSGEAPAGKMLQDFELVLTNVETGEEYHGDSTPIPKNTSVVVKRVPSQRSQTLRLDVEDVPGGASDGLFTTSGIGARVPSLASRVVPTADEFGEDPLDETSYIQREEERRQIEMRARQAQAAQQQAAAAAQAAQVAQVAQAAQAAQAAQQAQQQQLHGIAAVVPYVRPPPNRPPPPHYVCHNCQQRGHWKQSCPTAAHLSAPSAPRLMAVTGSNGTSTIVPRSMVMAAMQQMAGGGAGAAAVLSAYSGRGGAVGPLGVTPLAGGAPVAPAPAQPTPPTPAAATSPPDLLCTRCHRLFTQPMVVPCCFTSYCDECIKQALVEENRCPRCHSDSISVDQLRANNVMARRVDQERKRLAAAANAPPTNAQNAPPAAAPARPTQPYAAQHSSLPYQQQQQQPYTAAPYAAGASRSYAPPQAAKRKIDSFGDDEDYSIQRR